MGKSFLLSCLITQDSVCKKQNCSVVRTMTDKFGEWWSVFQSKTKEERYSHYDSLSRDEKSALRDSFRCHGWSQLFCQNHIDCVLDYIKKSYRVDLIDLRIKSLKFSRTFLIEKHIWEEIEEMIFEYVPLYNSNILFGGLVVEPWGKRNQFVRIAAQREGRIDA